jgi:hypothetical protein
MIDDISVAREAGAIRLQRSTFSGSFLLVEGSSDKNFYGRFVDPLACKLVTASGKPSSKLRVIEILSILETDNFQGVLAIVDADFDHLEVSSHSFTNLIHTDTHDVETMLLNSSALDKVLTEFGSEQKIAKFRQGVREALIEAGTPIGYLRWISQLYNLNLTFSSIKFSRFIDDQTLKIDELKLIEEVKNKSQAFELESADLQQRLTTKKNDNHDPWQICCGHDLVEILSLGFNKVIGSARASDVEPNNLERSLRLGYEEAYFHQTQIYQLLVRWETKNSPFRIFEH